MTDKDVEEMHSLLQVGDVIFSRKNKPAHISVGVLDGIGHVGIVLEKNGLLHVADSGFNRMMLVSELRSQKPSKSKPVQEYMRDHEYALVLRPECARSATDETRAFNACIRKFVEKDFRYAALKTGKDHSCTSFVREIYQNCTSCKLVNYTNTFYDGIMPSSLIEDYRSIVVYEFGKRDRINHHRLSVFLILAVLLSVILACLS